MDVLPHSKLVSQPKANAATGQKQNPTMVEICALDAWLLNMNLENTVPQEGSFEGWLY